MAITPRLVPGRVVRTVVPDPQGRNPKSRRCVVLDVTVNSVTRSEAVIVAVTSTIDAKYPDEYVALQFGPNAATGFRKRSAAHCIAMYYVEPAVLEITSGSVSAEYLQQITARVNALGDRVRYQRL